MATNKRDDFSAKIKQDLAMRVVYRCSNPDCRNQTLGPKDEPNGSVSIGVASHIKAAAQGGKRFDEHQTSKQRSAQNNAIWLCQNCAKLIDSDEPRFSVDLLYAWRESAERTAQEEIGKPPSAGGTAVHIHQDKPRPFLTLSQLGTSGGANGFYINFDITNEGAEMAHALECYLVADGGISETVTLPNKVLASKRVISVTHDIAGSIFFTEKLTNPAIVLEYLTSEGAQYDTGQGILQAQRADERSNLSGAESHPDQAEYIKIDIESSHSRHSKLALGIVDSFSVSISVTLRNLSTDDYQLRKITPTLRLPAEYQITMFTNRFTNPDVLPARNVLTKTVQFSASLKGRGIGGSEGRAILEESGRRTLAELPTAQAVFSFSADAVSVANQESISVEFDLSGIIIPFLTE